MGHRAHVAWLPFVQDGGWKEATDGYDLPGNEMTCMTMVASTAPSVSRSGVIHHFSANVMTLSATANRTWARTTPPLLVAARR